MDPQATLIYNPYDSVIEQILTLDAQEFEVLCKERLHAVDFEKTEVTEKTGDWGVDAAGILNVFSLDKVRVYVQAKCYKLGTKINSGVARQLRMAISSGGQGAFITTADY